MAISQLVAAKYWGRVTTWEDTKMFYRLVVVLLSGSLLGSCMIEPAGRSPSSTPANKEGAAATGGIETEIAGAANVLPTELLRDGGIAVTVRPYSGAADSEEARKRVVDAFSVLLKDRGYRVVNA